MGKMIMALKKLGNKLTGKTIESDNTVGVINEMADKYEGGGSSGGDTISLGTTFAVAKQIQGKHLDVDALLTLVNKYAPEGTQRMYIGLHSYEPYNLKSLIDITADGCSSGIEVAGNTLIYTSTYETDVAEFLTNNKTVIEEVKINIQSLPAYAFLGVDVYGGLYENQLDCYNAATQEEILSLFVD